MFLTSDYAGYNSRGEQSAAGLFLILFSPDDLSRKEIRCAVRHVRMTQMGHWMMGSARVGAVRLSLSGSYGSDGLTCDLKTGIPWETLVPLPAHLYDEWNTGGGHNSAGSEGPSMHQWAMANLPALRAAGKVARVRK